jgi:nicotinate-nucleotide adenylyltransferase
MQIGIFGGSFNPIHNGHLAVAKRVLRQSGLDEIWFVVSPHNPLKEHSDLLDDALRLSITRRAIEQEQGFVCSDYEFRLPRPSYMWHTLQSLEKDYPNDTFILIIGADNWVNFSKWFNYEEIIRRYRIIIYPREDFYVNEAMLPAGVTYIDMELCNISSTQIRDMLKRGEDVSALVPKSILGMMKYYTNNRKETKDT